MQIPATWAEALTRIQQSAPACRGAVLAGGALRDLDNGRPVKDLDVFISGQGESDLHNAHALFERLDWDVSEIDEANIYPVGENNEVIGFFEVRIPHLDTPPIQIIIVRWDTRKIVDRFDFGICKIAFDGAKLDIHKDYEIDKEAKQFRICRDRDTQQLSASIKRFARLYAKYEGWDFRWFKRTDDAFDVLFD